MKILLRLQGKQVRAAEKAPPMDIIQRQCLVCMLCYFISVLLPDILRLPAADPSR